MNSKIKSLLLFILLSVSLNGYSQNNFSKAFRFGYTSANLCAIELKEDTIIAYGTVTKKEKSLKTGVYFAKFDTSGNLLNIKTYFDTLGHLYSAYPNVNRLHRTSDGGFISTIQILDKANIDAIVKFDTYGNIGFIQEVKHPNPANTWLRFEDVVETNNGYMAIGNTDVGDYDSLKVVALNKQGVILWDKNYGEKKTCYWADQIFKNKNNNYDLMFAKSNECYDITPSTSSVQNYFMEIDSNGLILNTVKLQNSGKIMGTYSRYSNDAYLLSGNKINSILVNTYHTQVAMAKYNRQGAQEWLKLYTPDQNTYDHRFLKAYRLEDGILAVGTGKKEYGVGTPKHWTDAGSIYKLDLNGKEQWSRIDTIYQIVVGKKQGTDSQFYSAVVLPSGNIIAGGITQHIIAENDSTNLLVEEAWLHKVSKNGCAYDCPVGVSTEEQSPTRSVDIAIFPNPIGNNGVVHIQSLTEHKITEIQLILPTGEIEQTIHLSIPEEKYDLQLGTQRKEFIYLVKVKTTDGQYFVSKIVRL